MDSCVNNFPKTIALQTKLFLFLLFLQTNFIF